VAHTGAATTAGACRAGESRVQLPEHHIAPTDVGHDLYCYCFHSRTITCQIAIDARSVVHGAVPNAKRPTWHSAQAGRDFAPSIEKRSL
jgi:hypothetical protein